MGVTIVVPTFNEAPNVAELVRRVEESTKGMDVRMLFVDDSNDETPETILAVAASSQMPVTLIHRDKPTGGLGGAVLEGFDATTDEWCLVMDGDLQHPPETIRSMVERAENGDVDVVVASRYAGDGHADGLANFTRTLVSRASTIITKSMFPVRLRACSDPMTGFFLINRSRIDRDALKPRGFKILLEILARAHMRIAEVPFQFAARHGGESKASFMQGMRFLTQLGFLRFGRMSAFALIGGLGAIANLAIMAVLTGFGMEYVLAAVIAAEVTILSNFLLIERFVFSDLRDGAGGAWLRFAKSFSFNNVEALIRIPVIYLLVEHWHISSILAAAMTLFVAFIVRFVFHSLVVYAPKKQADLDPVRARRKQLEQDTLSVI
tara:strand:- start:1198 stop:2334 length:1137 start_codon:yes stop_codon:yes gene_type:complete